MQVYPLPKVAGSSPQVRGKPFLALLGPVRLRLIPAGAGKTRKLCKGSSRTAAHPRRCGENFQMEAKAFTTPGSSPQVRGKHQGIQ